MERQTIAVIGLGLIGGSLAFRRGTKGTGSSGYDVSEERTQTAFHLGAISEGRSSAAEAVKECDVVFIAAPVGAIVPIVEGDHAPHPARGNCHRCGQCKASHHGKVELLKPSFTFIGGHPMAGSEQGGIEAADANLFENAVYVLTPHQ